MIPAVEVDGGGVLLHRLLPVVGREVLVAPALVLLRHKLLLRRAVPRQVAVSSARTPTAASCRPRRCLGLGPLDLLRDERILCGDVRQTRRIPQRVYDVLVTVASRQLCAPSDDKSEA